VEDAEVFAQLLMHGKLALRHLTHIIHVLSGDIGNTAHTTFNSMQKKIP
jgi:hypothetical protein